MANILTTLRRGVTGKSLSPVHDSSRGWWPLIREPWSGAWQRNVSIDAGAVEAHHAVFACTTLIAGDMAKMRLRVVRDTGGDVWEPTRHTYVSPLLDRPNHYQTRYQFVESWVLSKLRKGNTYCLLQRNGRGDVVAMHILDPNRVKPLVAPDGSVYYELHADNLAALSGERIIVPAREIAHDRANCFYHPLVGIAPIFASGLAAMHGLNIQTSQAALFQNAVQPGGILTAPGEIDPENAERLKQYFETNFGGKNTGRIAILGDGLKFEKLALTADEAQLVEQLKLSAEIVCSTYHVAPFMVGLGAVPALGSIEALQLLYFGQAVQAQIEAMEACLDKALGLSEGTGVEFDTDGLLRMDTTSRVKALTDAVGGSIMTPNEARSRLDLPPVDGGDECYAQQQDFALSALAERDRNKPFANPQAPPQA